MFEHTNKHTKARSRWCILFGHGFNEAFYEEQDYRIASPPPLSLSLPADWTLSTLSFKRLDLAMPLNATVR